MKSVIIYKSDEGVSVLYPVEEEVSVNEIGERDVPAGMPFWIVSEDALTGLVIDALEIDETNKPDGYGGGGDVTKNK